MAGSEKPKVIAVVGPTATGKTGLGVALAKAFGGEVISADSRVIYRELDIGTAKPTVAEMDGIAHHMIDVAAPDEQYSVARYRHEAQSVLEQVLNRGCCPIVVGGTGFYIRALLQSGFIPATPPNEAFRADMEALGDAKGNDYLYQLLSEQDPRRAAELHPNDRFRIVRALEIIHTTGQPVPQPNEGDPPYTICWLGLTWNDRDKHRAWIDHRIDVMLAAGWLAEVEALLKTYGSQAEALQQAHGYPEWVGYLQGQRTYEDALAQVQLNVHQYARRQRTWFGKNHAIVWSAVDEGTKAQWTLKNLRLAEQFFQT